MEANIKKTMDELRQFLRERGMTEEQIDREIAMGRKNVHNGKYVMALPMILKELKH